VKPTFQELTPVEHEWVAAQTQKAFEFVVANSPDTKPSLTLEALDEAFSAWLAQGEANTDKINQTINAVGVAFGSFLVRDAGFAWVIATDEHGSDLAVLALPGTADIVVFPANFVAKRWERKESFFMEAAFEDMSARARAGFGGVA